MIAFSSWVTIALEKPLEKGTSACIARTGRYMSAFEEAGLQVTVCSPSELATSDAEISTFSGISHDILKLPSPL